MSQRILTPLPENYARAQVFFQEAVKSGPKILAPENQWSHLDLTEEGGKQKHERTNCTLELSYLNLPVEDKSFKKMNLPMSSKRSTQTTNTFVSGPRGGKDFPDDDLLLFTRGLNYTRHSLI